MTRRSRSKGLRRENEATATLVAAGIPAKRRSGMYVRGHDIDIEVGGRMLKAEMKSRATGFTQIYRMLDGTDVLLIKADRKPILAILPLSLAVEIVGSRRNGDC
jgi:hypothetical protein